MGVGPAAILTTRSLPLCRAPSFEQAGKVKNRYGFDTEVGLDQ